MNCLKHGYNWPHDKTCPYCDVERLTGRLKCSDAIAKGATKALSTASEQIERLTAEGTRLHIAAKAFVDGFSVDVIQDHGYQQEWNNLCDAVFSVSGSQKRGCPYCTGDMDGPICGDISTPFSCTRPPGHDGPHVACGAHHDVSRWEHCAADDSKQE